MNFFLLPVDLWTSAERDPDPDPNPAGFIDPESRPKVGI
jgi:hypothetical protein